MKKILLILTPAILLLFTGCKKNSDGDGVNYGTDENTWTFTQGSTTYKGNLLFDASLNTLLQGNNTYTYSMIGPEEESGFFFNLVLSLTDLTFTNKTYQSGISGTDHLNAFYFFEDFTSPQTYLSSNNEPGQILNYSFSSYNAGTDVVTISFSGQVKDEIGNTVNITNGKVTAKNERF